MKWRKNDSDNYELRPAFLSQIVDTIKSQSESTVKDYLSQFTKKTVEARLVLVFDIEGCGNTHGLA